MDGSRVVPFLLVGVTSMTDSPIMDEHRRIQAGKAAERRIADALKDLEWRKLQILGGARPPAVLRYGSKINAGIGVLSG